MMNFKESLDLKWGAERLEAAAFIVRRICPIGVATTNTQRMRTRRVRQTAFSLQPGQNPERLKGLTDSIKKKGRDKSIP